MVSNARDGKGETGMGFGIAVERHRMLAAVEAAAASGELVRLQG